MADGQSGNRWRHTSGQSQRGSTMKFAVLSHNLPPAPGQALVLYKLLSGIDPSQYILISQKDYESGTAANAPNYDAVSASQKLPVPYYKVSEPSQLKRGSRFGLKN